MARRRTSRISGALPVPILDQSSCGETKKLAADISLLPFEETALGPCEPVGATVTGPVCIEHRILEADSSTSHSRQGHPATLCSQKPSTASSAQKLTDTSTDSGFQVNRSVKSTSGAFSFNRENRISKRPD